MQKPNELAPISFSTTASHAFPYVKKRIPVVSQKDHELSPIEGAIDEMQKKVQELQDVVAATTPDFKKLQLKLQGSVSVQVRVASLNSVQICGDFFGGFLVLAWLSSVSKAISNISCC